MTAICPCDDDVPQLPVNLPQQNRISFRHGDYAQFRRAVLTPVDGEQSIAAWRTQGQGDLAVMMAEWFAYIGDILTFYDERIANQSYLRTADLDASARRLIQILGYRPRPAIGATGMLAALVVGGQSAVLPRGLQFQSKPAPGQQPQIFELAEDTPIAAPDRVPAKAPSVLLSQMAAFQFHNLSVGLEFAAPRRPTAPMIAAQNYQIVRPVATTANFGLLMLGDAGIDPDTQLLFRIRDAGRGGPYLARATQAVVQPAPEGGEQTALALDITDNPASPLTPALAKSLAAADVALEKPVQSIAVWSLYPGGINGPIVHLASVARQIRAGDWILFAVPGWSKLLQVDSVADAVWDAVVPPGPLAAANPLPVPHTVLTLNTGFVGWPSSYMSITAHFDWIAAGQLIDQPPGWWNGTPSALVAASADRFRAAPASPVLLEDQNGVGALASAAAAGDFNIQFSDLPAPPPSLAAPIDVYYNVLKVSRGKTVSKEILGSGDAAQPNQSYKLSQSPVTWFQRGASAGSTVAIRIDGEPWTEVASLYDQPADAQVFVTREDVDGHTHVDFGDGVEGARLPSGVNNVVADYRVGAGASSPAAGKLTVIAQSFPGLRALRNPVAVGGGADAQPVNQIRRYAPRSVLTFGRAVSVFDYEAIAAQAPGVTRARASWSWSNTLQRAAVVVYVGDDQAAADSARGVIESSGDPNRPVQVQRADPAPVTLTLSLLIVPGLDEDQIRTDVTAALLDPERGLFCAERMAIGQTLFDSQIEEAVLAVSGTVAITASSFAMHGTENAAGPLHNPGEGGFFTLDPLHLTLSLKADSHDG